MIEIGDGRREGNRYRRKWSNRGREIKKWRDRGIEKEMEG